MATKPKLTPEQIAQIIAGNGGQGWNYRQSGQGLMGIGDGSDGTMTPYDQSFSYRDQNTGIFDNYGADGTYLNSGGDSNKFSAADYLKFAALVSGVGALNGGLAGLGGAASGTTAASAAPGSWLSAVPGMNALDIAAAGAPGGAAAANLALPEILAGTGAAAAGGGALGTAAAGAAKGGITEAITNGASAVNKALGGNLGGLLGAGVGALSSQDQTSSKDPWAPAQDWIKSNISQGQKLQDQYTAQPFNDAQKTQYNNIGGLLNTINQMSPAMFQNMGYNASGQNQFSRANPTRSLLGNDAMKTPGLNYNPGLLNFFPGAK